MNIKENLIIFYTSVNIPDNLFFCLNIHQVSFGCPMTPDYKCLV